MSAYHWPHDRIRFVIEQRTKGRTATEIAKDLKREFGVVKTRNSIIGILTRHNVPTPVIPNAKNQRMKETNRVINRLRAKKPAETLPPLPAYKGPVQSPNARHWTQRCDTPDHEECAYLLNDGRACCNPVAGPGSTFRRRYCAGHLAGMVDTTQRGKFRPSRIETLAKLATRNERVERA